MLSEVECFRKWLRCRNSHASACHNYTGDLTRSSSSLVNPVFAVTATRLDRFIEHTQQPGHVSTTIDRRLH